MDYHAIEAMNLFPPELLTFMKLMIATKDLFLLQIKDLNLKPLSDATNQFGSLVTGTNTLATLSKGFVSDNTKLNTQWPLCMGCHLCQNSLLAGI